jgi:hypothetical protein
LRWVALLLSALFFSLSVDVVDVVPMFQFFEAVSVMGLLPSCCFSVFAASGGLIFPLQS